MAYIYDLSDAWAASGTTFKGIALNVTDTASAAGSLLMDLQVGGVSRFSVRKDGYTAVPNILQVGASANTIQGYGGYLFVGNSIVTSAGIGFAQGAGVDFDVQLRRDAANTLAQRNGVNAQAFNLYNTYTDASNYERVEFKWLFNIATLESVAAGTGTRRTLRLKSGGGSFDITNFTATSNLNLEMANNFITGPSYIQFTEQTAPAAPATNAVRIYAEDDGAGKTRLMARFATGASQQIAIEP